MDPSKLHFSFSEAGFFHRKLQLSFGWMFSIVSGYLTDVFPFHRLGFSTGTIYFTKFDLGHIGINVWFSSCHTLRSRRDDYLFKGEVTSFVPRHEDLAFGFHLSREDFMLVGTYRFFGFLLP